MKEELYNRVSLQENKYDHQKIICACSCKFLNLYFRSFLFNKSSFEQQFGSRYENYSLDSSSLNVRYFQFSFFCIFLVKRKLFALRRNEGNEKITNEKEKEENIKSTGYIIIIRGKNRSSSREFPRSLFSARQRKEITRTRGTIG